VADLVLPGIVTVDEQLASYYTDMDELTVAALAGRVDEQQFKKEAERLAMAVLVLLFLLGGGDQAKQQTALTERIQKQKQSIDLLADDIYSGRYSARTAEQVKPGRPEQTADEARAKLLNRLVMWVTAVYAGYNIGRIFQSPRLDMETGQLVEPAEQWRRGATKEGCTDCVTLDGVVLTVSDWQRLYRAGVYPQSGDLECTGRYCLCTLTPTDLPAENINGVLRALRV
jgi:hypothetical protein